jgi:hypothetical protein
MQAGIPAKRAAGETSAMTRAAYLKALGVGLRGGRRKGEETCDTVKPYDQRDRKSYPPARPRSLLKLFQRRPIAVSIARRSGLAPQHRIDIATVKPQSHGAPVISCEGVEGQDSALSRWPS